MMLERIITVAALFSTFFLQGSLFLPDAGLSVDNGYLYGVRIGDSARTVYDALTAPKAVTVTDGSGNALPKHALLGTGNRLVMNAGTTWETDYHVVIPGDLDGNGKQNTNDLLILEYGLREGFDDELTLRAADMNGDRRADTADHILLRNIVGEPGDDAPYRTQYTLNYAMQSSGNRIRITSDAPDGVLPELTFVKTAWGTWNLGDIIAGGTKLVGNSDWEYVFRVQTTTFAYEFVGGNHANEALTGIALFDADTGEALRFDAQRLRTNGVKIVENTIMKHPVTGEGICEVVRTYVVRPGRVVLDVDYSFIKDIEIFRSYFGMLPFTRNSAHSFDFYSADGSCSSVILPDTGADCYRRSDEDGFGYYEGFKVNECFISDVGGTGYGIRMRVGGIGSEKDFDAFCVDMGSNLVKLYFSRFELTRQTVVSQGTVWHSHGEWTLYGGSGEGY